MPNANPCVPIYILVNDNIFLSEEMDWNATLPLFVVDGPCPGITSVSGAKS